MPDHALHKQLEELTQAVGLIASTGADDLADLRTQLLGRKAGKLTHILRGLRNLDGDERREVGQRANQVKRQLEDAFAARQEALAAPDVTVGDLDLTMPGRRRWRGAIHPVTAVARLLVPAVPPDVITPRLINGSAICFRSGESGDFLKVMLPMLSY